MSSQGDRQAQAAVESRNDALRASSPLGGVQLALGWASILRASPQACPPSGGGAHVSSVNVCTCRSDLGLPVRRTGVSSPSGRVSDRRMSEHRNSAIGLLPARSLGGLFLVKSPWCDSQLALWVGFNSSDVCVNSPPGRSSDRRMSGNRNATIGWFPARPRGGFSLSTRHRVIRSSPSGWASLHWMSISARPLGGL